MTHGFSKVSSRRSQPSSPHFPRSTGTLPQLYATVGLCAGSYAALGRIMYPAEVLRWIILAWNLQIRAPENFSRSRYER
jgi:hypothetical protein